MDGGEKQDPIVNPEALEPLHSLEYNKVSEEPAVEYKTLHWQKDVQLYATFLDRKEDLMAEHTAYMEKHPELQALLADFLQLILSRKPQDPIFMAATFFASLSANTLPETSNVNSL
uniref:ciliogenesis-associated TTC17-interacting protein n=1 Tax=Myxine glutinosa TaxID=7769 RepID=UPI0035901C8E